MTFFFKLLCDEASQVGKPLECCLKCFYRCLRNLRRVVAVQQTGRNGHCLEATNLQCSSRRFDKTDLPINSGWIEVIQFWKRSFVLLFLLNLETSYEVDFSLQVFSTRFVPLIFPSVCLFPAPFLSTMKFFPWQLIWPWAAC